MLVPYPECRPFRIVEVILPTRGDGVQLVIPVIVGDNIKSPVLRRQTEITLEGILRQGLHYWRQADE
jgi:hypothetical protein